MSIPFRKMESKWTSDEWLSKLDTAEAQVSMTGSQQEVTEPRRVSGIRASGISEHTGRDGGKNRRHSRSPLLPSNWRREVYYLEKLAKEVADLGTSGTEEGVVSHRARNRRIREWLHPESWDSPALYLGWAPRTPTAWLISLSIHPTPAHTRQKN